MECTLCLFLPFTPKTRHLGFWYKLLEQGWIKLVKIIFDNKIIFVSYRRAMCNLTYYLNKKLLQYEIL